MHRAFHRPGGGQPWQDAQLVCENGHQLLIGISQAGITVPDHCTKCGAKTHSFCPNCQVPIPGRKHNGMGLMDKRAPIPDFCGKCGKPFPWMKTNTLQKKDLSMTQQSNRVFIVHGHDDAMKEAVARTLTKLGLDPIILHEQANEGKTIIEKFEKWSDVGFALVLMSPDDLAFPKTADVKKDTPTFRARQNVIFELGYFIGTLGRERVLVLQKDGVESLSDYSGVLYEKYDNSSGPWRFRLVQELQAQGYDDVSADMLTRGDVKKKP